MFIGLTVADEITRDERIAVRRITLQCKDLVSTASASGPLVWSREQFVNREGVIVLYTFSAKVQG